MFEHIQFSGQVIVIKSSQGVALSWVASYANILTHGTVAASASTLTNAKRISTMAKAYRLHDSKLIRLLDTSGIGNC